MEKTKVKFSILGKIYSWMKGNKTEFLLLLFIIIVGAFLRLYKIDQYMTFLGDEGRDVIIVRRLLVYGDPILIGPGTSIGNMYLGPLYYYMMAPALFLAGFSPVGPAIQVALLGVITIFWVWWIGREWFGKIAGLLASGLFAVAPTVIIYSRSSWNPNIMPFFSLLSIYSIWKVYESRGASRGVGWWLIILGISYAFVLQSHYLGLLLAPTLAMFWLATYLRIRNSELIGNWKLPACRRGREIGKFLRYSIVSLVLFAGLMSPLLIFDARHGWRNFAAMKQFFSVRQETVSAKPWNAIPKMWPEFIKVNTRLVTGRNELVGKWLSVAIVALLIWLVLTKKKELVYHATSYILLATWFGFALLGLGLYKQEIYDHYFGFFFAAPFLLVGGITADVIKSKRRIISLALLIFCLLLLAVNLQNVPIKHSPNMQMQRSISVAKVIQEKANGERFNLATISERNNRDVYQYFLQLWGAKIVDTDPSATTYTLTDQLFVVCEISREKCDPVHDPSAWITSFGWTKIVDEWPVWGGTLFKLGRTK